MTELLAILIPILMQIESNNNPDAIGDNGDAVGILQIHEIMVDDVNRIIGTEVFDYDDRTDKNASIAMCRTYLKHYGRNKVSLKNTKIENLVVLGRMWNAGPKGHTKLCSLPYAKKIVKAYASLKP